MSGQRNRAGTRNTGLKSRAPLSQMSAGRERRLREEGRWQPGSTFARAVPGRRAPGELPAGPGFGVRARTAPKAARQKPFPPKVAALLDARDEWCQRCGSPGPLHRHHRRAKGIGGDTRACAQCPCNGLLLCGWSEKDGAGGCHRWAHEHPEQARAEGWIVSREVTEPGRVSVMRGSAAGGGASMHPDCEGNWLSESPWTAPEAGAA